MMDVEDLKRLSKQALIEIILSNQNSETNTIKICGYPEETCGGCPTVFEFDDYDENHYYFRLRHGAWRLQNETTDEVICSGDGGHCDGVCSWEEALEMMAKEGFIIS